MEHSSGSVASIAKVGTTDRTGKALPGIVNKRLSRGYAANVTECAQYCANASVNLALSVLAYNTSNSNVNRYPAVLALTHTLYDLKGTEITERDRSELLEPFQDMGTTKAGTRGNARSARSRRSSHRVSQSASIAEDKRQNDMIQVNYQILHARADGTTIPWNLMVNQLTNTALWAYQNSDLPSMSHEDMHTACDELKSCLTLWECGKGQAPTQHLKLAYTMTYDYGDQLRMSLHGTFPIVDDEHQIPTFLPKEISAIYEYVFGTVNTLESVVDEEDEESEGDQENEADVWDGGQVQAHPLTLNPEHPMQPYAIMTIEDYKIDQYDQQGPDRMPVTWEGPNEQTYQLDRNYGQGGEGSEGSGSMSFSSDEGDGRQTATEMSGTEDYAWCGTEYMSYYNMSRPLALVGIRRSGSTELWLESP
ncbi:hypothetical protein TREMEDRAFT_58644 [Tremella mesenterica DSM 1558]|uniref:uncharacterized protein n=1 Tax=Tremella mesenterica (strain ATCC 24925 / CBS 8224 / DSM 1558 / NBRC 9311 / NRRL Y-6157 / RJB 2259-6 / UBC 559-6) TaxID=578456 RepID=UPI0003F49070|nr:uncharacterized protein TREMEDRAFT_58644 [Tremella mesenterica DSM 1558]EIW72474.1 hypothetical protein TREMEDRAFT_58644 [Tremella mesenterica DSM 1558]